MKRNGPIARLFRKIGKHRTLIWSAALSYGLVALALHEVVWINDFRDWDNYWDWEKALIAYGSWLIFGAIIVLMFRLSKSLDRKGN